MYEFVNLSNREVAYRLETRKRREEVMRWRSDHEFYVAAEKRRRRLTTLGEIIAAFGIIAVAVLYSIILPGI